MAVEFPSDLILDVARAADPAATRNLEARLNTGEATGNVAAPAVRLSRTPQAADADKAAKQFESLLVSNMIEDMMGDAEQSYFGGGFAGDVWKSMMAQQIAARVVETADFGVASKVRDYFIKSGDDVAPLRGINDAQSTPEDSRSLDAARSGTNEISREFIRDMMSANRPDKRG